MFKSFNFMIVILNVTVLIDCVFVNELRFQGRHYVLSNLTLTYEQASAHCSSNSYKLLEIQTDQIQQNINSFFTEIIQAKSVSSKFIWIGLKLRKRLTSGRWNRRTFFISTSYSNWGKDQPELKKGLCGALLTNESDDKSLAKWYNRKCESEYQFICEGLIGENEVKVVSLPTTTVSISSTEPFSSSFENITLPPTTMPTTTVSILSTEPFSSSFENTTLPSTTMPTKLPNKLVIPQSFVNKTLKSEDLKKFSSIVDKLLTYPIIKTARKANIISKSKAKDFILLSEQITNNIEMEAHVEFNLTNLYLEAEVIPDENQTEDLVLGKVNQDQNFEVILPHHLLNELHDDKHSKNLQVVVAVYHETKVFKAATANRIKSVEQKPNMLMGDVLSVNIPHVDTSHLKTNFSFYLPNKKIGLLSENKSLSELDSVYSEIPKVVKSIPGVYWEKNSEIRYSVEVKCASLNTSNFEWTSEGCEKKIDKNGKTICVCSHMTHFSIILEVTGAFYPKFVSYITMTGCSISVVCLFLTIGITLSFRELRNKIFHQIILHICFALLSLNIIFMIGIDQTSFPLLCVASTLLLHYAVLLAWSWMLLEGFFLFKSIVWSRLKSRTSVVENIILATFTCYAIPAIIVATCYFVAEEYKSDKYCWLSEKLLYKSVVLPIAAVLTVNVLILILVMYYITCRASMLKRQSNYKTFSLAARRACCMLFALGVPWVFGYFMILAQDQVTKFYFSVIFSGINSLQGLAIFFFYCFRQEHVKSLCKEKLLKVCRCCFRARYEKSRMEMKPSCSKTTRFKQIQN